MKKKRLAYLVTHPIQYQAPLLRLIAQQPDIDLYVFFCSDLSVRGYYDPGFKKNITWDVPLTEGYAYEFLPALVGRHTLSFLRPIVYGLKHRLQTGKFDVLWVHGWGHWSHVAAVFAAHRLKIKVLMRGESSLQVGTKNCIKRFIKTIFFKHFFAKIDAFLSIGTLNRQFYQSYGISANRIFDVPYAVDNNFFQAGAAQ